MISRVNSAALLGIDGVPVELEVDIDGGLPRFEIVGLPDTAVQESRVRVRSAISNSDYDFPMRRIHVNLAPADLRKVGPSFDLPLALGILSATGQISVSRERSFLAVGELALDGKVRRVNGLISIALMARERGIKDVVVPGEDAEEAALVEGIDVYGVSSLREAVAFMEGGGPPPHVLSGIEGERVCPDPEVDFYEIKGQLGAKRAVEVAASGGHHLLMVGPPGAGKTLLAKALAGVIPPLEFDSAIDVTRIHSAAGRKVRNGGLVNRGPFRSPHNSISLAGMVGGGVPIPRPGEVSLAHHGILYLDEVTQFRRDVLESLRGPLEDGRVSLMRSMTSITYPSEFMLVASMNPCRCGYLGDSRRECICSPGDIERYRNRISGPLLDRLDIQIEVPRLSREEVMDIPAGEGSSEIASRIKGARNIQVERLGVDGLTRNGQMGPREIERDCSLGSDARGFLGRALESMRLSARATHRVLRVARTIADMEESDGIEVSHVAEALQYRCMERRLW